MINERGEARILAKMKGGILQLVNNQKGLAPILVVILIALVVFFAPIPYYQKESPSCEIYPPNPSCGISKGWHLSPSLWQHLSGNLEKTVSTSTNARPTPAGSAETANPDSIGANWKTYTNTAYKFSFTYPPHWSALESTSHENPYALFVELGPASTIQSGGLIAISIRNQIESDYLALLNKVDYQIAQRSDIQLGQNKATRYKLDQKSTSGEKIQRDIVLATQNGLLYEINRGANSSKDNQLVFDQILSTFQFSN